MIISSNWLSEYVEHGLSVDELADRLTMCGLEVDGIERLGSSLAGVVIGHVLETAPHPDADRLTLCQVSLGDDVPVQIVCGASNVAAGQRVPVATVGTTLLLPSRDNLEEKVPVTLKKAKLRGQESYGMICAEDELGVSDDHSGIMVLPEDAPIGADFTEWMRSRGVTLVDAAIDVAITPNRPDAVSHIGMARDIAALTGQPLRLPSVTIPATGGKAADQVQVSIEAPELCARYVGLVVRGVTISESPTWLKQRLTAIGLRPRNNVVDITNFVMYESGQPLHAFDLDTLRDQRIVVRATNAETTFTTLDSKERTLPTGTLMICDGGGEVAIAGIMGGENSEVTDGTTNVLIESAWFDPSSIRRTAKTLQLQTDASYRFERGVDPTGQAWAAARAAELMRDLAGGTIVDGMVDANPAPYTSRTVSFRPGRVETIMGVSIPADRIEELLVAIGFGVDRGSNDSWTVTIPPYRPDVEREIDVVEEVARLYGFDNIPEPEQSNLPNFTPDPDLHWELRNRIRGALAGAGFREIYTNSMLPRETADAFMTQALPAGRLGGTVVETLNPITTEMATLRSSLLPGALKVVDHNRNHGQRGVRFFEFGRVHAKLQSDRSIVKGYTEVESLVLVASGEWSPAGWMESVRETDHFDLKGAAEHLFRILNLDNVRTVPVSADGPVDQAAQFVKDDMVLGTLGRIPGDRDAFFVELDWSVVAGLVNSSPRIRYAPVSRFPQVERDLALVMDASVPVGNVQDVISDAGGDLLKSVDVFDMYQGEHLPEGQKSVAFSLVFGADRTLRDKDVDAAVARILERVETGTGAHLRK